MEARKCLICGTRHWSTEPCPAAKESTAARKDVHGAREAALASALPLSEPVKRISDDMRGRREKSSDATSAGTQALPVDTHPKRGKGRPASIDDMKTYKARKAKEYRAKKKAKADAV